MNNKKTLDIIIEIHYKNQHYYAAKEKDGSLTYYGIHPDTRIPESPIVSYTHYNDEKYYKKIEDEQLVTMLRQYVTLHSKR